MLHLKTPLPVLEFAKAQASFRYTFIASLSLDNKFEPELRGSSLPDLGVGPLGEASPFEPSSPDSGPNVTFLLTRLPVLGSIKVA